MSSNNEWTDEIGVSGICFPSNYGGYSCYQPYAMRMMNFYPPKAKDDAGFLGAQINHLGKRMMNTPSRLEFAVNDMWKQRGHKEKGIKEQRQKIDNSVEDEIKVGGLLEAERIR